MYINSKIPLRSELFYAKRHVSLINESQCNKDLCFKA